MTIFDALEKVKRGARGLTYPFAAFGLAGGWLVSEALRIDDDATKWMPEAWFLPITTMLLCGGLGALVAPQGEYSWLRFFVLTPFAGALNGLASFFNFMPRLDDGVGLPLLFIMPLVGAIMALPFLAPFAVIAASHRTGGFAARPRSIIGRANLRGVWVTTLAEISGVSFLVKQLARPGGSVIAFFLSLLCALALADLLVLHLVALRRVRAFVGLENGEPDYDEHPTRVDYGIGDAIFERRSPSPTPYRAGEVAIRIHYGDGPRAAQFLTHRITWASFAFLASFILVAAHCAR